jgi:hypothetical protein
MLDQVWEDLRARVRRALSRATRQVVERPANDSGFWVEDERAREALERIVVPITHAGG